MDHPVIKFLKRTIRKRTGFLFWTKLVTSYGWRTSLKLNISFFCFLSAFWMSFLMGGEIPRLLHDPVFSHHNIYSFWEHKSNNFEFTIDFLTWEGGKRFWKSNSNYISWFLYIQITIYTISHHFHLGFHLFELRSGKTGLLCDYGILVWGPLKESSDHHCKKHHANIILLICRQCHVGECSYFFIRKVMTSNTQKKLKSK